MSTIDPRAAVLAALHARLSPLGPSRPGPAGAAARSAGAGEPQAAASAAAQRIAAIDRTDPDRRRKAVRAVLEAELARTFGGGLLNDPAFPGMLDTVQDQMQADAQAAAAVHALGELLLAGVA